MRIKLLVFLFGIFFGVYSQNKELEIRTTNDIRVIPMVFHVIHGGGIENITDGQIIEAVKQLNEDYNAQTPGIENVIPEFKDRVANVGIRFALAKIDPDGNPTSGIVRYYDPSLTTSLNDRDIFMKDRYRWEVGKYLNVYVVRSSDGEWGSGYTDGIHYEKEDDGIVISYWAVGRTRVAASTHIKILTHEMGHWLGLGHTFSKNCEKDGDGILDTPPCTVGQGCNLYDTVCGVLANRQNFMDYTRCQVMFTEGQKEVMLNILDTAIHGRNQIGKMKNQIETGVSGISLNAEFYSNQVMTVPGNSIEFVDVSFNEKGKIVEWKWEFEGGTPNLYIGAKPPEIVYNTSGKYDVVLTVKNDKGEVNKEVKPEYIGVQKEIYMQNGDFVVDSAKFFDPGYKTKYGCRTDLILTIRSKNKGKVIQTIFNRFEMDPKGEDYLKIFNGSDTTDLIGTYWWYDSPGRITSTHGSGALTFVFHSNKDYRYQGWEADVKEVDELKVPIPKILCLNHIVNLSEEVYFSNIASGIIGSYNWTFPGGNPEYSEENNPVVRYFKKGKYDVELVVKNKSGENKLILKDYISVGVGHSLPFLEDFEGDYLPFDWKIESYDPIIITEKVDYVGFQSEACLMLNNNNRNSKSCEEEFVLPALNLSKKKRFYLTYDYAYTRFNDKSKCGIKIYVSIDGGRNWENILAKDQDNLETAKVNWLHSSGWLPVNESDWRNEEVDLSKFGKNPYVLIKFESVTEFDTNIWIDNIKVSSNSVASTSAAKCGITNYLTEK